MPYLAVHHSRTFLDSPHCALSEIPMHVSGRLTPSLRDRKKKAQPADRNLTPRRFLCYGRGRTKFPILK